MSVPFCGSKVTTIAGAIGQRGYKASDLLDHGSNAGHHAHLAVPLRTLTLASQDGSAAEALFANPLGLALSPGREASLAMQLGAPCDSAWCQALVVCDHGNHCVRAVMLSSAEALGPDLPCPARVIVVGLGSHRRVVGLPVVTCPALPVSSCCRW